MLESSKHNDAANTWLTIENGCTEPVQVRYCKTLRTNTDVCDSSGYLWGADLKGGASTEAYYENKTRGGILYLACKASEGGRAIRAVSPNSCFFVK